MIEQALELARAHAPLLVLAAPLAGAAAAAALPSGRLSWVIAVLATAAAAVLACDLAARTLLEGAGAAFVREVVPLHVDGVAIFSTALVALAALLAVVAAGESVHECAPRVGPFSIVLALLVGAGWTGALFAADLTALLLAAETGWLAGVGLVALGGERDRAAISAALRMLVLGAGGTALALLGAGLIFRAFATLDVAGLALAQVGGSSAAAVGVGLVFLSLALKAGAAPLHAWVGAAFGRANSLVAMSLGVTGAVGALCVMAKLAAYALPAPAVGEGASITLAMLGAASVVAGSVQAVGAHNLRRLAAYAGIAQAGAALIAVALGSPAGYAAALVQIAALAAGSLALFAAAAASGVYELRSANGLVRRAPFASVTMAFGALNLMGAPLTIGFLGRWRLVEAGVGAGWWWAVGAVTIASFAGVFFGGRLIERLFFRRAETTLPPGGDRWRLLLAPALIASMAAIALGAAPATVLAAADSAAQMLSGGRP